MMTIDAPYYLVHHLVFELQLPLLVLKLFLWGIFLRLLLTIVIICLFLLRFAVRRAVNRMHILYIKWQISIKKRQMQENERKIEANLERIRKIRRGIHRSANKQ
jgi:hypothetical protein